MSTRFNVRFYRTYPILPHDLASAIQQFSESDYAKQYFSTHRTGFIFRRKVPVAQMMTWQKVSCSLNLLLGVLTDLGDALIGTIDFTFANTDEQGVIQGCGPDVQGDPAHYG